MHAELVQGVSRPPRREDYFAIVKGMRPFCRGEELDLRASLLLIRDRAMATKATACDVSYVLLNAVEQQASEHALNPRMDVESLRELRRLCVMCVANASSFDTLYRQAPHAGG